MAGKITNMTLGSALSGSEFLEMVQNSGTFKTTIGAIGTYNSLYTDTRIASVSAAADQAFTNELYVDTKISSVSAAAEQYTNTQIAAISGATGSFIASGGETVTVVNGLITSIV